MSPPQSRQRRRQIRGVEAIERALADGLVRVLLVPEGEDGPQIHRLLAEAARIGARVFRSGAGDLRRMSASPTIEGEPIAMLGPNPDARLEELLGRGGAIWLLHRAAYPSNVGFAIRTAEVSGAAGVVVDGVFNHAARSRVSHVSMGADRLLPVVWEQSAHVVACAKSHGLRVVAIEDVGAEPLWDIDLKGDVLLIVGNERDGIEGPLLAQCDAVTAIPMAGFVPSYNVQAAISAVAVERLRQLASPAGGSQSNQ